MLGVLTAKPWATVVVAVVVAGAAVGTYLLTGDSDSGAADGQVTTRLVAATTGTVRATVPTTGTITAADSTDASFSSAAEVTSVRVEQGDTVTKGQVLGTIDTLALKSALAKAKAVLADAKATLASAEGSSSTTDAQLSADEAAVASAKGGVTTAKQELADATLRSPISGTVAEVNVAKGDRSTGGSGSDSSGGGSGTGSTGDTTGDTTDDTTGQNPQNTSSTSSASSLSSADFVVVGMKKWTVTASVDDTQVGLIKKGNQAQITTDNVTGTVFGVVSSVSVLSSSSSGTAGYPVEVTVTGSPSGLHDGASATLAIVYKQATNVLTVPTAAVHSDGSTSYVYVSANGTKTKKTVTTGLASGGTTQIKSGLAANAQVYVDTISQGTQRGTTNNTQQNTNRGGYGQLPGGGNIPAGKGFPGGGPQVQGDGNP